LRTFHAHVGTLLWLLVAIALRIQAMRTDLPTPQQTSPSRCHAIHRTQICCAETPRSPGTLDAAQAWILGGRMNLNTATSQQLALLPGIGPRRAHAILESRERQGAFRAVTDLERVPGLGPGLRRRLEPFCEVGTSVGSAGLGQMRLSPSQVGLEPNNVGPHLQGVQREFGAPGPIHQAIPKGFSAPGPQCRGRVCEAYRLRR
jgi:competence ComEA-like helix-hairpin-helix protein